MKKAIAMLLAGVMTLSLTACSGNTASETNSGTGENKYGRKYCGDTGKHCFAGRRRR